MLRREVLLKRLDRASRRSAPPAPLSRYRAGYLMVDESCRIVEGGPAVSAVSDAERDPRRL